MSDSRRKNSIQGNGGNSEKKDKRHCHKKFRQAERQAIHHDDDPPEDLKEVESCWGWSKDGKHYFGPGGRHYEEEEYDRYMRK